MVLKFPQYFNEKGQRQAQEDALWPSDGARPGRSFIVCDGMGGPRDGALASTTVADALGRWFDSHTPDSKGLGKQYFNSALRQAYRALDEAFPEVKPDQPRKPGTTMAALVMGANTALVAHIGDCRVYQYRPGEGFILKTIDHSLVAQMVARGEITAEAARTHPRRNVVTRAMQPAQGARRPAAELQVITDVRPGDSFFLCTDGVRETLSDRRLLQILKNPELTDTARIDKIRSICRTGGTIDNFTAMLITVAEPRKAQPAPVAEQPARPRRKPEPVQALNNQADSHAEDDHLYDDEEQPVVNIPRFAHTNNFVKIWFFLIIGLIGFIVLMYMYMTQWRHNEKIGVTVSHDTQTEQVDNSTPSPGTI